jgi:hypothetical protein
MVYLLINQGVLVYSQQLLPQFSCSFGIATMHGVRPIADASLKRY